ncbi:MAG TPA: glycosyltransferase family 39 protein [Rhodocyclaceae bacterium]
MHDTRQRRYAPPPLTRGIPLVVLLALFLASGILGHDPWKSEDAIHFGTIWRAALDSEWLLFSAAEATGPAPPLYFWVARVCGVLFGSSLGLPDAFRIASLLFAGAACALIYLAATELFGKEAAPAAPLALAGCLGFLVQSHETQPLLAVVAAICALLAGVAALHNRQRYATPMLAAGLAGLVLADGLTLLPAGLLILASPLVAAERSQRLATGVRILIALLCAAVVALPWYLALARAGSTQLAVFLGAELAQLAGVSDFPRNAFRYLNQLGWFAWPAWPLAVWGLWSRRHAWRTSAIWLGAISFFVLWIAIAWIESARAAPALLLLPPLALLAAQGVPQLRRGAAHAFDWFGRLTFGLLAFLLWFGWFAMQFQLPPKVSHNILRLTPGFEPQTGWLAAGFALTITGLWLWFVVRERRSPLRSIGHWTAGITLVWCLAMSLWLPWIEHLKSYRPVGTELLAALGPAHSGKSCIEPRAVAPAQLSSIEFAMNRRLNPEARPDCRYLLIQGSLDEFPPEPEWRKVWEGNRPGDRHERLRLYHRG